MSTNDLNKKSTLPPLKKTRLGRGLGSLLGENRSAELDEAPEVEVAAPAPKVDPIERQPSISEKKFRESKIWKIDIEKLNANQQQPRKYFEKDKLKELAESIKVHGIMNPIVARKKKEGGFEIIAGERRWRASQLAGLKQVPVILKEIEDKQSLELAIIENVQRHDLNPIEEAAAFKKLMEDYGLTQAEVAQRLGKERSSVANTVRLLLLPPEVTQLVAQGRISSGHAKVLLSVGDAEKQIAVAKRIVEEKLSVRATEKALKEQALVAKAMSAKEETQANVSEKLIQNLSAELQKALGTKVNIDYKNAKGKLSLHFYSDDQLNTMADRLKEAWQQ